MIGKRGTNLEENRERERKCKQSLKKRQEIERENEQVEAKQRTQKRQEIENEASAQRRRGSKKRIPKRQGSRSTW